VKEARREKVKTLREEEKEWGGDMRGKERK